MIKEPQTTLEQILEYAKKDEINHWTIKKWIVRRKIPLSYQVQIVKRTNGRINFEDMETLDFVPNRKGQGI